MGKFNTRETRPATGGSPIVTEQTPTGRTFEGGPGFARDAKSELFLLAVSNMVGEKTFYEDATSRDARFERLVAEVAVADAGWMLGFVGWLRSGANMRTASLVAAAEAVRARLAAAKTGEVGNGARNRQLIADVLQRADEPGELLAYWTSRHGCAVPKPVKRGIGDAVQRLYTEYALAKYDSRSAGFRFGYVLHLTHPPAANPGQGALFRYALDRRHNRDVVGFSGEQLPMLYAREQLLALPVDARRALMRYPDAADQLRAAGITWEALAGWLQGPMDAAAWEAVIPSMGYMALLRNLRNFDEAGVHDLTAAAVALKLAEPWQVARSRQLPMRFLSAYRAAPSLRWAYPLEQALGYCLANVPELTGRTLILVDTSSSMNESFSKDGKVMRWDAAATFGVALAQRCAAAEVVSFSSTARMWGDSRGAHTKAFPLARGESLLRSLDRWKTGGWFLGGGTATAAAVRKHFAGHDRVVIVTDEQAGVDEDVSATIPATVPLYTWNLAGYEHGHGSGGVNRHTFGGLTDAAFRMIPLIEAGKNAAWPWL